MNASNSERSFLSIRYDSSSVITRTRDFLIASLRLIFYWAIEFMKRILKI